MCVCVCVCVCTWPIGTGLLGVEFGPQRSARLQFSLGELGQVGHDGVFVHIGVNNLFRGDHLRGEHKETNVFLKKCLCFHGIIKSGARISPKTWKL